MLSELGAWSHCQILAIKGYLVGHVAGFVLHRLFPKLYKSFQIRSKGKEEG